MDSGKEPRGTRTALPPTLPLPAAEGDEPLALLPPGPRVGGEKPRDTFPAGARDWAEAGGGPYWRPWTCSHATSRIVGAKVREKVWVRTFFPPRSCLWMTGEPQLVKAEAGLNVVVDDLP